MKRLIIIVALSCIAASAYAQSLSALLIPTDARSLSMGGMVLQPDAPQLYAGASYGLWAPGTAGNNIFAADAYIKVGDKFALTLGGKAFMDKPYEIYSDPGAFKGNFKPYDMAFSLGGIYYLNEALDFGLKLSTISSILAEKAKGSTFCADLSARYSGQNWSVTLSGRNLGPNIDYGNGTYPLPMMVAIDGEWSPLKELKAAAGVDYLFSGAVMLNAGAEYCFADMLFARAGFHYGDAAKAVPTFISAGLGAKYAGVQLDAAYIFASPTIGNSLMLTLGYAF